MPLNISGLMIFLAEIWGFTIADPLDVFTVGHNAKTHCGLTTVFNYVTNNSPTWIDFCAKGSLGLGAGIQSRGDLAPKQLSPISRLTLTSSSGAIWLEISRRCDHLAATSWVGIIGIKGLFYVGGKSKYFLHENIFYSKIADYSCFDELIFNWHCW